MGLGKPGYLYPWTFDACTVAFSLRKVGDRLDVSYHDVTMQHYRAIVHALITLPMNSCVSLTLYHREILPAIKLNCRGDRARFRIPEREAVAISMRLPLYECQWPSPLAWIVGLPWMCRLPNHMKEMF